MRLGTALALLLLAGVSCIALADDIKIPNDLPFDPERTTCPVTDYTGFPRTENLILAIVDQWYTAGPIQTTGTCPIEDVIVDLGLVGTWLGDLIVEVYYDRDCNGTVDVGPVALLCRPNLAGCSIDGCCGCSGDANGTYRFAGSAIEAMGEPNCPTSFPTGNCYLPAPDSPNPLSIFAGETAGGCFSLRLADCGAGDTHTLTAWEVWVKCGVPVPDDASSWGVIKSIFR